MKRTSKATQQSYETDRARAVDAIILAMHKLDHEEIDDIARIALGLPNRPKGAEPYKGWLLPIKERNPHMGISSYVTSQKGINLIKKWEGFRSSPYVCPGGVWTIGYGHTREARAYKYLTEKQAEELLRKDLSIYENHVNELVKVELTQNQFDALVSFCYNLGGSQLRSSTLLKTLNNGDYKNAARWFEKYVYAAGRKLKGLEARRKEEKMLFLS